MRAAAIQFNLATDPNENHNLARSEPGQLKRMMERVAYYNSTVVFPQSEAATAKCEEAFEKPGGLGGHKWVGVCQ